MVDGRPLPPFGVRAQYLRLALQRISGQMPPGAVSLRFPRVTLHVHKNPWRLYKEIFLQECYKPLVPLGPTPRILDIGANIGLASLYFLSRWPAARLTAWEPNPAACKLLLRNILPSHFPEAELCISAEALSDSDGWVQFLVPADNPTAVYAGIPRKDAAPDSASEEVTVKAVDAARIFAGPADLLKLDIEGHEYEVLDHAIPKASDIRSLAVEFHRVGRNLDRVERLVTRLVEEGGYQAVDGTGEPLDLHSLHGRKGSLLLRFFGREG